MSQDCAVCLKPNQFCTCIGAEKKHLEASRAAPIAAPVGLPEDKITEESHPKHLDTQEPPKEEGHGIFGGKKHKKKKHHE